jgi:tetratricopeptide (TPR) repeat protein
MKKKPAPSRPQPAQIQAIERCLERGDLREAKERLHRLQAAFPDFKPLRRLAFEIAWEGGHAAQAAAAAWDWCEASPGSAAAFNALRDASLGHFPYLFLHAAERARALGEIIPEEGLREVREMVEDSLDERDGLRFDLSRAFMGAGRNGDARPLVETLDHPAAQNNFAQILFAEGEIERAAEIFESVLAKNPADNFALSRLATLRLWLSGKAPALDINERLLAGTPADPDELRRQLESALLFGQPDRADGLYRLAPDLPWYEESEEYDPESRDALHYLGAMAAWRMGDRHEALRRLKAAGEDNDEFNDEHGDIGAQCLVASISGDTPDWTLGALSQWWPLSRILSLRSKFVDDDNALFENWQVPMPHCDYLVAVAASGGNDARVLALAALRYLTNRYGELREGAIQALFELLRLPCGPDKVRSELHAMMADDDLLDGKTPVEMFVGGALAEIRPLAITIREGPTDEETVLEAADLARYLRALDHVADDDLPRALELMEDLLSRYPDYPRILTAAAMLRQGNDQPCECWAPLARRAAEIDPDYFFSRTGMARLLAAENKIEEARESLRPLLEREEMHRSEWRSLIGAQIAIAQAEGDFPAVARLRVMLRNFDRSNEQT